MYMEVLLFDPAGVYNPKEVAWFGEDSGWSELDRSLRLMVWLMMASFVTMVVVMEGWLSVLLWLVKMLVLVLRTVTIFINLQVQ